MLQRCAGRIQSVTVGLAVNRATKKYVASNALGGDPKDSITTFPLPYNPFRTHHRTRSASLKQNTDTALYSEPNTVKMAGTETVLLTTPTMSEDLTNEIKQLEKLFTVPTNLLQKITAHFTNELIKGLTYEGGSLPMNPTWCLAFPTGLEQGDYLALDMGGTNMRVCEIKLLPGKGEFEMLQTKYRMPDNLKTGTASELWSYIADCLEKFIVQHHGKDYVTQLPLGFTFSYPATQDYIDHGILQRWTKGFDISGVEGLDVVPPFEAALKEKDLHIKLTALINDTVGTLVASAYVDEQVKIGCIFGTGCNAAYMENCGSIPKLAHMNLEPDLPMTINIEWGAFDNERVVLPLTIYDLEIDRASPRPGQQTFEKMIAGLYLGEIFRLALLDLHARGIIFKGQDAKALQLPYTLDSGFLSDIEEDPQSTRAMLIDTLQIQATPGELILCQRLASLIATRAARLSACGIAAICKKKNWSSCHVGADGTLFHKYTGFQSKMAQALRDIMQWHEAEADKIVVVAAEDGSGVGAALIAALTAERVKAGILAGIRDPDGVLSVSVRD